MENEPLISISDILEDTASKMLRVLATSKYRDEDLVTRYYASLILAYYENSEMFPISIEKTTAVFLDRIGIGHYITYHFSNKQNIQSPYVTVDNHSLPETIYKDGASIELLVSN